MLASKLDVHVSLGTIALSKNGHVPRVALHQHSHPTFPFLPPVSSTFLSFFFFRGDKNRKQNEAQSARAESTHKGDNQRSKNGIQLQVISTVPLVAFMYLVFTRMPGESYRRRLRSLLLYLRYFFRALINSLVC